MGDLSDPYAPLGSNFSTEFKQLFKETYRAYFKFKVELRRQIEIIKQKKIYDYRLAQVKPTPPKGEIWEPTPFITSVYLDNLIAFYISNLPGYQISSCKSVKLSVKLKVRFLF